MRLATLVLFLSALLLPLAGLPVQADDGPLLTARQAEWQDAQGDAGLLALRDLDGAAGAGLSASSIHVREVMADLYAYARGPTGDAFVAPQWTVHESDLSGASLRVTPGRPGSFLYLLPSSPGAVAVSMPCGSAQAADSTHPLQAPSQIESPNPSPAVDLSQALRLTPCGPVQACGSFTVVLWERDAAGSSSEGDVRLESGQSPRPGEPDLRPTLGAARQLYLTATDGCLSMTPAPASASGASTGAPEVFTAKVTLAAAPALVLHGARGALAPAGAGAAAAVDGDLRLTGRLDAALARKGTALGVDLAGRLDGAAVDGRPLGLAAAAALPAVPRWAWLGSLALLLLALPAALWLRGLRPAALARRAERAARQRAWGRVLALTTRRLRRGDDARTRILRANALLALDDLVQALSQARLALLRLPDGPTKADAALVACRAASRLGRDAEALAWLGEVFAQDGRTAEHALRFPEVARLATAQDVSYS